MEIYITRDGQQFGPYSESDCRNYILNGQLLENDFAWREGLPEWQALKVVLATPVVALQIYVSLNGQQSGPFTLEQLKERVKSGEVTPDAWVWLEGMAGWEALSAKFPEAVPAPAASGEPTVEKRVFTIESQDRKTTMRISIPDMKAAWLKSSGRLRKPGEASGSRNQPAGQQTAAQQPTEKK
jgi:hypothetical protein